MSMKDSQQEEATRAFTLQSKKDVVKNAAVPEGLFIEEEKLVKFTLMSKVLKFLFGFWKKDKKDFI